MKHMDTDYGVKKVINASGKMTIIGGSRVNEEVVKAMTLGATNFFEIKDLLDKTGEYIASLLNVESAYIVNSATGGIAQCIASCICKRDNRYLLDIYNPDNTHREVLLCKGHNIDYGTAIEVSVSLGGGKVVEAGYANTCTIEHLEYKITKNTIALLYIKSHHCVQKGMPSIADFVSLGKKYDIPVIVDAAAEEDLTKYYQLGVDAIIYSGTKAIAGPTSGLLIGNKLFIEQVKKQAKGIGRSMKVGKESILGLTVAITNYVAHKSLSMEEQKNRLTTFNRKLNSISGIEAICIQDGAGREILRSEITIDEQKVLKSAKSMIKELKQGNVAIYTREYRANEGKIEIDIRDVSDTELEKIYKRITEIVGGNK